MTIDAALGVRIADARGQKGYSVKKIAGLMGVTEKTVRRWESGKTVPRSNKLQMLSGVLGVPLLWIIDGSEEFEPETSGLNQIEQLGKKVDRMAELQQELLSLTEEVSNEVEELQQIEEDLEVLAE